MGKRKRSETSAVVYNSLPSDSIPCSSGRDLKPGENSSNPDDGSIFKPHPSLKEIMDSHGKQPNSQISFGQHHHNLSRSMYLKRSRHHYGNQYSRRNSSNYHKSSISFGKGAPFHEEQLCFKLGSKYNSDFGHRSDFTELAFFRPERIRSSASLIPAVSPEGAKRGCLLCDKPLRRKPLNFRSTIVSEEPSVVAVLVCGHIFHADCLEHRTCFNDQTDPPCPVCLGFLPEAKAEVEAEAEAP